MNFFNESTSVKKTILGGGMDGEGEGLVRGGVTECK